MPTSEPLRAAMIEDAHSERIRPGAQSGRSPDGAVCWLPSRLKVITFVLRAFFRESLRAVAETAGRSPISRSTWAAGERRRGATAYDVARARRVGRGDGSGAGHRRGAGGTELAGLVAAPAGRDRAGETAAVHPAGRQGRKCRQGGRADRHEGRGGGAGAELAVAVAAPAEGGAGAVERTRARVAGGDGGPHLAGADGLGRPGGREGAGAELAVLVQAPAGHLTGVADRAAVAPGGRDLAPAAVRADLDRGGLVARLGVADLAEGVLAPAPQRAVAADRTG